MRPRATTLPSPPVAARPRINAVVARWIAAGYMKAPLPVIGNTGAAGNPDESYIQPPSGLPGKQAP